MNIRVRFSHVIPRILGAQAIVLYPYVLFDSPMSNISGTNIRHEMIHVRQVRSMGWLKFYVSYLWEYAKLRLKMGAFTAYLNIPQEQEAYAKQDSMTLTESERSELGDLAKYL